MAQSNAEQQLRNEWDLLKTSGLLSQIGGSAGPKKIGKKQYNMFEWNALIKAPKNSPYNGYMFQFEIKYPENYPEEAPKVKCVTKIYHMNIKETTGDVCVSSIKNPNGWANAKSISEVLKSIFVIFKKPNKNSPYNGEMAKVYNTNPEQYEKNIKEYCEKYAIKCPD